MLLEKKKKIEIIFEKSLVHGRYMAHFNSFEFYYTNRVTIAHCKITKGRYYLSTENLNKRMFVCN